MIEGWHGVPFDRPVGRTREIIEICRMVWRRERLSYDGKYYKLPLPADQGTGLGKPLKLINHPVRERIPVLLASLGPKNVALTAEIAEGWQPIFFHPEKAADVWGASLAEGKAKRDPALGELDTFVTVALAIGDDVEPLLDHVRPMVALYVGGMGARGKNFYNDLVCQYGFEKEAKEIQDLYLGGNKRAAEKVVPLELLELGNLVGPASYVKERIAAFAEAGVTDLQVLPVSDDPPATVRQLKEMVG